MEEPAAQFPPNHLLATGVFRAELTLIKLQNIVKNFNRAPLLKGISLTVQEGERVSLIGPGGCGKSTVLKILLGLVPPDEGEALLFSTDMCHSDEDKRQSVLKRVGMAFQQGGLFDFMTVRENLLFAMEHMTDKDGEEMEYDLKRLLAGVKLPKTEGMFPHELSGGMKRRVGIARALCTDPDIAIFDEPTAGLDPVTSTIILNMIDALGGKGGKKTMLVASSNVEIAIRFADRIVVINEGLVVADGPWRQLLVSGPPWVQHFLSTRLIGLDIEYAHELHLPPSFIRKNWSAHSVR
ncbi:MAG: ATP-binding cassette domain-containing protein [Deltaproteobacteria bacterium]|nr:ATP-binding cassette domain-containing protein [Deltaproteobacteria bacterium]